MPPSDVEVQRLELDQKKFAKEDERWEREFLVRTRDQDRSKWTSPIVLAIFTAALAALGNIVLAFVNGSLQRDSDDLRARQGRILEKSKSEATLVLEMIKTDADKAAINLEFLVDSGLLTDPEQTERIKRYLKERKPGQGPSLPSPGQIEPSPHLSTDLSLADIAPRPFAFGGYENPLYSVILAGTYSVKNKEVIGKLSTAQFITTEKFMVDAILMRLEIRACYSKPGISGFDAYPKEFNSKNSRELSIKLEKAQTYLLPTFDFSFPLPQDGDGKIMKLCAAIYNQFGYYPVQ
jgi:hypothetical protein